MTTENQSPTSVSDVSVSELSAQSGPSEAVAKLEEIRDGIWLACNNAAQCDFIKSEIDGVIAAIQTPPAGARDAVTKVGYVFEMKDQDGRPELHVSWEDDIPPEGTELFTLTGKADGGEVWSRDRAHIANEFADMAANGLQWLRNIKEDISTVDEALAEEESNMARIRGLQEAEYATRKLTSAQPAAPYKLTDDDLEIV